MDKKIYYAPKDLERLDRHLLVPDWFTKRPEDANRPLLAPDWLTNPELGHQAPLEHFDTDEE